MEKIIDSHAHIYLEQFDSDRDEMISRAAEAGVSRIMMPNVDHETIDDMLEAELRYEGMCKPMMGLHPCSVGKDFEKALYVVEDWLKQRRFSAVGEIGTDLYWDRTYWDHQQEAFRIQMKWAEEYDLPAVIHCRDSIDETIDLAQGLGRSSDRGIFHCFSGSVDQARTVVDMGFSIGIGGVATFKNGRLDDVLREVPLEHMVLETDSPYLAPEPNRGKRNEPSYLPLIAEKIARVKEVPADEVITVTSKNCMRIFGLNEA
jgi:TatD DNase family protein